jgi:hypothetical protein
LDGISWQKDSGFSGFSTEQLTTQMDNASEFFANVTEDSLQPFRAQGRTIAQ